MSLETLDDFLNSFFFLSSLISDLEMITHQETKTKDEKDYIMILLF